MAEATTIRLNANGPLDGSGHIPLKRAGFTSTANGSLHTASIPEGSRVGSDLFGFFGTGGLKAIRVFAATHNPRDVVRVYSGGTFARTELQLSAGPHTITLGPGEELAFVTEAAVVLQLVVDQLVDGDQPRSEVNGQTMIRALLTREVGFSATGVMNAPLTWSAESRVLRASNVGAGALPLELIDPRESRYAGYFWRVRVSGCDGNALVGAGSRLMGEVALSEVAPGQWSNPVRVSHDDLLAVQSPGIRPGFPRVLAEHELIPIGDAIALTSTAAPAPIVAPTQEATGVIPMASFVNLSVNAAGAVRNEEGWEMWTHATNNKPPGEGNKGFNGTDAGNMSLLGTDFVDNMPLGDLTSLSIHYCLRTAGNHHELNRPQVGMLIDLNGDGTLLRIGVFETNKNPKLNLLTDVLSDGSPATDHEYIRSWVGGGKIKIVDDFAAVVPAIDLDVHWRNKVYTIPDILAVFPKARLVRGFMEHNALPAGLTMPPLLLALGDPTYARYSRIVVRRVRVNG